MGGLAQGWDAARSRLLCREVAGPGDFSSVRPGLRYVGACLLAGPAVARLQATPTGLFEVLWRDELRAGVLELVTLGEVGAGEVAIDCGTPADYLAANLHASGGAAVVDPRALVEGHVERCVVWDGAYVGPDEYLVDAIRAGSPDAPLTVLVPSTSTPTEGPA
jgi:hypothetical protein